MRQRLLVVGLLLAGCAADRLPAGQYATADEALSAYVMNVQMNDPQLDAVSYNVKHTFADCTGKYLGSKMSGSERFDVEKALHNGDLAWRDLADLNSRITAREGRFTIDELADVCPAYIIGFKKYYADLL